MTQKEKELLLKDLSARLSYGVKVEFTIDENIERNGNIIFVIDGEYSYVCNKQTIITYDNIKYAYNGFFADVKPYLFPLSNMTKEQSLELFELFGINVLDPNIDDYIKINEVTGITFFLQKGFDVETHLDKLIDWLLKNHFDFRGLIPKGLALDATGLNIY
jgi:hypothetical protein